MPVSLEQIVASTRRRVAESRRRVDLRDLERRAQKHEPRGFRLSLRDEKPYRRSHRRGTEKGFAITRIDSGQFRSDSLARELEGAGAAALSVLTDEEFFKGSLDNLSQASNVTNLPCLRKDFIVDQFQVVESRAYGADAILLIVAALSQAELIGLAMESRGHGLDVLCEVHDEAELQRALEAGCKLIGVNNRDLRTFKVDLETAIRLSGLIPKNVIGVAESGINADDLIRLRAAGYQAFLIGESLMRAESPGEALRSLIASSESVVPSARWGD